jgi:thiol-disulfide isomerase/thioredoxin
VEVVPIVSGKGQRPVKTADDGSFETFLPEGAHALAVHGPSHEPLEVPLVVARRESVEVELRLAPQGQDGSVTELGRSRFEAPDADLQDLAGNPVRLADFRGKFVVLNFWATWCEPCITEWPQVDRLSSRLAGRDDVVILAVSIDTERDAIEPFLAKMGLQDSEVTVLWDPTQSLQQRFGTDKLPDTYFVDEAGELVHVYVNLRKWGAPEAFHCVDGMIGR